MSGDETLDRERVISEVLGLAAHVEVAHELPGRIRLRILPSGVARLQETQSEVAAVALPGIRGVRVNPFARSVVIEYSPSVIPPGLWRRLVALRQHPERGAELAGELRSLWDAVESEERAPEA